MYQTHGHNDLACVTCGQTVWFNIAYPTGKWTDPRPEWVADLKVRAEKLQKGLEKIAAELGVIKTEPCEFKCQIVVTVDSPAIENLIRTYYPNGFSGIPLQFKVQP